MSGSGVSQHAPGGASGEASCSQRSQPRPAAADEAWECEESGESSAPPRGAPPKTSSANGEDGVWGEGESSEIVAAESVVEKKLWA